VVLDVLNKDSLGAHAYNQLLRRQRSGESSLKDNPDNKSKTLSKNTQRKRAGGVVSVVEHLPSKCEALSSNPSIEKKY
jgi:hypothetical protein